MSEARIRSAESLFDKYGVWAVLVAAVTPIPYKVFTILAGVLKLDMKRFLIASIIGRGMRFLSLAVVIFLFGEDLRGKISLFSLVLLAVGQEEPATPVCVRDARSVGGHRAAIRGDVPIKRAARGRQGAVNQKLQRPAEAKSG